MDLLHTDLEAVLARALAPPLTPPPSYHPAPHPPPFNPPLDADQARAAAHFTGPIRVLAPAGSGKTRTLTARIGRLVDHGVPPEKILALAFNRMAAAEMLERLAGSAASGVQARTFHSLGYEIVRDAGGPRYREGSGAALRAFVEQSARATLPIPEHPGEARRALENIHTAIARAKSRLTPYFEMTTEIFDDELPLAPIFRGTLAAQHRRGWLTFPDMIYFALTGLADERTLRARWQARFDFILVDEFQDLNAAQMLFLRILSHPQDNLFVVGDDDQLIYAWRGAEEAHILEFETMYPDAETVILNTNYRSGRRIVRHGRRLIENNPARVAKDIRPTAEALPGVVDIRLGDTPQDQLAQAAAWMHMARARHNLDWSDFGVLYRTNRDGERAAKTLERLGIPFKPPERPLRSGAPPGPPEHTEAGRKAKEQGSGDPHSADVRPVRAAAGALEHPHTAPPVPEEEVFTISAPPLGGAVEREEKKPDSDRAFGRVTLMTIHKAKGVEFPFVVYFNMSLRGGTALTMPDERRVAYVGVTRAGRGLLITARTGAYARFLVELALNPGFDDFSEPYLERQLALRRRRTAWARRDWRALLESFAWRVRICEPDPYDEEEDLIVSELRFRRALGISREP